MQSKYNLQWLEEEELWYLTIHGEDGITFEGWYYGINEALADLTDMAKNK